MIRRGIASDPRVGYDSARSGSTAPPREKIEMRRWPAPWLYGASLVLLCAAGYYQLTGFYNLVASSAVTEYGPPHDLRMRWVEFRYIVRHGQNPFDIYFRYQPEGPVTPPKPIERDTTLDPELGVVPCAAYPPWAYPVGAVIWWPPWPAVRWWAAALDAIGLAFIAYFGFRSGRRIGLPEAVFLAAVCLAPALYKTTLSVGQVSIYVVALIAASLLLTEAGYEVLSGAMLGLAMIKPNIAAPFVLIPLVRRRWSAVATCAGICLVGTAIVALRTGVNPLEMLSQMARVADQVELARRLPGTVTWIADLGISPGAASRVALVVFLPMGAAALWFLRRRPPEVLYAVTALTTHLWAHHKSYDEGIMLLLVVPFLALCLERADRWPLQVFGGLLALSILHLGIWRVLPLAYQTIVQTVIWTLAVGIYVGYLMPPEAVTAPDG